MDFFFQIHNKKTKTYSKSLSKKKRIVLFGNPSNSTNINNIRIYYQNERKNLNEIEKVMEKMNYYKNSGMNDLFKG